jgi:hypothetical protein
VNPSCTFDDESTIVAFSKQGSHPATTAAAAAFPLPWHPT